MQSLWGDWPAPRGQPVRGRPLWPQLHAGAPVCAAFPAEPGGPHSTLHLLDMSNQRFEDEGAGARPGGRSWSVMPLGNPAIR